MSDGVAPPRWEIDFRLRPPVREDLPEAIELFKQDDCRSGGLKDFERHRRQHWSRYAFRPATLGRRSRAFSLEPLLIQSQCLRPEWNLFAIDSPKLQVLVQIR